MLKIADIFAGIGGIRRGFELAFDGRVECVFSSEIDKYACQTYRENYGESPFGDIREIHTDLMDDFDILLAGFPCQPFSMAGKKGALNDDRGTLFFEIERILGAKRPRAFLLENVKNLKTIERGAVFEMMLKKLKDLGYTTHHAVLKARDFGVPQNRERVYIVGFWGDLGADFTFPGPLNTPTKVGDILESEVSDKYTISDRLWQGHQRRKEKNSREGKGFGYSLFNAQSPYTSTISARYYKDGSEILIAQEGKNPRKLTPREAARLQGFGDDFKIVVGDTQAYKQFGNSVAVPVIAAIAAKMKKVLDD